MPLRWPLCHQADEAHLRVCVHIGCMAAALLLPDQSVYMEFDFDSYQ